MKRKEVMWALHDPALPWCAGGQRRARAAPAPLGLSGGVVCTPLQPRWPGSAVGDGVAWGLQALPPPQQPGPSVGPRSRPVHVDLDLRGTRC